MYLGHGSVMCQRHESRGMFYVDEHPAMLKVDFANLCECAHVRNVECVCARLPFFYAWCCAARSL